MDPGVLDCLKHARHVGGVRSSTAAAWAQDLNRLTIAGVSGQPYGLNVATGAARVAWLAPRVRFHEVCRSVAATRTRSCAREATDIRTQPHSNRRNSAARCREGRVFAGGDGYR